MSPRNFLTESEIEYDETKSDYTINPWPLAIMFSAWLWLGIWLVARVVAR